MLPTKLKEYFDKHGEDANPFQKPISDYDKQRIIDAGHAMGKSVNAPRRWVTTGLYPYELLYDIEARTNGAVPASKLRPEIFANVPCHAELGKIIVKMFMVTTDKDVDEALAEKLLNALLKINPREYWTSLIFISEFDQRGFVFVDRLLANVTFGA